MEGLESRVRRMDPCTACIAFLLANSHKIFDLLLLGHATQGAELEWPLLRMRHNVRLGPWRPWNVLVVQWPYGTLRPEGFDTCPVRISPCGDKRVLVWCLRKAPCAGLRKQSSEDGHMETNAKVQIRAWGPVHLNLLSLGTLSESLSGDSCSAGVREPLLVQGGLHY